ncbi:MAG: hypothetical protein JXA00_06245 [Candidatus Thermoplasmatota archaeon]|nr:hypothetical protein [Candidatus Thermoplasmatota archaeon]
MNKNKLHIWIWMQDNQLHKAAYNPASNTLVVTNERDEIILRRTGITPEQLAQLEMLFVGIGAKRIDGHREPFSYL